MTFKNKKKLSNIIAVDYQDYFPEKRGWGHVYNLKY